MKAFSFIILFVFFTCHLNAQVNVGIQNDSIVKQKIDISQIHSLDKNGLIVSRTIYNGQECIEAYLDVDLDQEQFIGIPGTNFKNGTIELEVTGEPGKYANEFAKGFVGIAFRTQNDSTYECMYIRPVNSIDNNQMFRNWSVQYTSRPIYTWQKLREDSPGIYETYGPTKPGEWTKLKIIVKDSQALLFVNDASEPTLIVNDLKMGADISGGIGLWVGSWTLAHFRNLQISN